MCIYIEQIYSYMYIEQTYIHAMQLLFRSSYAYKIAIVLAELSIVDSFVIIFTHSIVIDMYRN